MKFKVGDKIKVIDSASGVTVNSTGEVTEIIVPGKKGQWPIRATIDGISNYHFAARHLELVESLSQEQVTKHPKCPVPFGHHANYKKQCGHPEFYKLLEQMAELHSRKNHDYAGAKNPLQNLKASERIGIDPFVGVMIRLQDKWSRLESFMQSGEFLVKDESVEDTLMDNAVYSLLAIILRREQKNVTPKTN